MKSDLHKGQKRSYLVVDHRSHSTGLRLYLEMHSFFAAAMFRLDSVELSVVRIHYPQLVDPIHPLVLSLSHSKIKSPLS